MRLDDTAVVHLVDKMSHKLRLIAYRAYLICRSSAVRRTDNSHYLNVLGVIYLFGHKAVVGAFVNPYSVFLGIVIGIHEQFEFKSQQFAEVYGLHRVYFLHGLAVYRFLYCGGKLAAVEDSQAVQSIIRHLIVFVDDKHDLVYGFWHTSRQDIILGIQYLLLRDKLFPDTEHTRHHGAFVHSVHFGHMGKPHAVVYRRRVYAVRAVCCVRLVNGERRLVGILDIAHKIVYIGFAAFKKRFKCFKVVGGNLGEHGFHHGSHNVLGIYFPVLEILSVCLRYRHHGSHHCGHIN